LITIKLQCTVVCNTASGPYRPTLWIMQKHFKGQSRRFTLWKLIPNWYILFPSSPDHTGEIETNLPTILRNKPSTA